MTAVLGIDVSNHNGQVDWPAVARAGVQFMLAKASEGVGFTDGWIGQNLAGAAGAGVLPGAYHFLRSTAGGAAQCDRWLQVIGGPAGKLLALDIEPTPTDHAAGREVLPFLAEFVQQAPGRTLFMYSSRGLWAAVGGPGDVSGFPVAGWHAGAGNGYYTSARGSLADELAATTLHAQPWAGITDLRMVQFTDHATVPGVSAPCDGNVWQGSLADLQALAGVVPAVDNRENSMRLVKHGQDILWTDGTRFLRVPSMDVVREMAGWTGQDPANLPNASQGVMDFVAAGMAPAPLDPVATAAAIVKAMPASPGGLTPADVEAAVRAVLHNA